MIDIDEINLNINFDCVCGKRLDNNSINNNGYEIECSQCKAKYQIIIETISQGKFLDFVKKQLNTNSIEASLDKISKLAEDPDWKQNNKNLI